MTADILQLDDFRKTPELVPQEVQLDLSDKGFSPETQADTATNNIVADVMQSMENIGIDTDDYMGGIGDLYDTIYKVILDYAK